MPHRYFHVDIAQVQAAQGKRYLLVAMDWTSKFALTKLHSSAEKMAAAQFLHNLVDAVPYALRPALTDNGIQVGQSLQ